MWAGLGRGLVQIWWQLVSLCLNLDRCSSDDHGVTSRSLFDKENDDRPLPRPSARTPDRLA